MMMTDSERREVAAMLRELPGDSTYPDLIGVIADRDGWYPASDAADRLADLIEPARGSGGRAILCAHCESASWCGCEPGDLEGGCDFEPRVDEGEPPYNLYSLYEVVFRRRPRDEDAIEDDEVRELVGALLDICNAPGHDLIEPGDTSQSCRDSVACDREAPETCEHWLDGECYALRTVRPVDRETLLALADKARKLGDEEGGPASYAVRCTFRVFARDIYKALGEVVA